MTKTDTTPTAASTIAPPAPEIAAGFAALTHALETQLSTGEAADRTFVAGVLDQVRELSLLIV